MAVWSRIILTANMVNDKVRPLIRKHFLKIFCYIYTNDYVMWTQSRKIYILYILILFQMK